MFEADIRVSLPLQYLRQETPPLPPCHTTQRPTLAFLIWLHFTHMGRLSHEDQPRLHLLQRVSINRGKIGYIIPSVHRISGPHRFNNLVHDPRLGKSGHVTQVLELTSSDFSEQSSHNFTTASFRQPWNPVELFRGRKCSHFLSHDLSELMCKICR